MYVWVYIFELDSNSTPSLIYFEIINLNTSRNGTLLGQNFHFWGIHSRIHFITCFSISSSTMASNWLENTLSKPLLVIQSKDAFILFHEFPWVRIRRDKILNCIIHWKRSRRPTYSWLLLIKDSINQMRVV